MVKKYVTWVAFGFDANRRVHPSENYRCNWLNVIQFNETAFDGLQVSDARHIGVVEIADELADKLLPRFYSENTVFGMTEVDEDKVNQLLLEWYGEGMVSVTDFVFTDNRDVSVPGAPD